MHRESFSNFKKRIRANYDLIMKVHCPVLNEDVYFNAQGFYHLRYEVTGRERTLSEQAFKLHLVEHIEEIVKKATIIDETRLEKAPIGRKKKSGKKIIKEVIYYAVSSNPSTAPRTKIIVILRRVGNGKIIFWSVMK